MERIEYLKQLHEAEVRYANSKALALRAVKVMEQDLETLKNLLFKEVPTQ